MIAAEARQAGLVACPLAGDAHTISEIVSDRATHHTMPARRDDLRLYIVSLQTEKKMMRKPQSVAALEKLGRVRLSRSFYMREFLYSEIANFYGIPNIPDDPDLAIEVGRQLCEHLLEPLNATFGRVAVRSSYRSVAVNDRGVGKHNCAQSSTNFARHIWDRRDHDGACGATACIAIPWFTERYLRGADWRSLAYWIHDYLPYSEMEFFDGDGMCTFNLAWHEQPKKTITSYITKRQVLLKEGHDAKGFSTWYEGFPPLRAPADLPDTPWLPPHSGTR